VFELLALAGCGFIYLIEELAVDEVKAFFV
jgi:hypothetical protein